MGLPLMMGLVPGENIENLGERPAAFLEGFRNDGEVGRGEAGNRALQMLPRLAQHVANVIQRGDVIVRSAAAAKPGHFIRKLGRRAQQALANSSSVMPMCISCQAM
jgi:hypothetical protein